MTKKQTLKSPLATSQRIEQIEPTKTNDELRENELFVNEILEKIGKNETRLIDDIIKLREALDQPRLSFVQQERLFTSLLLTVRKSNDEEIFFSIMTQVMGKKSTCSDCLSIIYHRKRRGYNHLFSLSNI